MPNIGDNVQVRPAPGLVVHLIPNAKRPCPPEGANVAVTAWILARLRQGDLVLVPAVAKEG